MTVQAAHSSNSRMGSISGKTVASATAGLNIYRSDPDEELMVEWENCLKSFTTAIVAKHSISLPQLGRVPALTEVLAEEAASKTNQYLHPFDRTGCAPHTLGQVSNHSNCHHNPTKTAELIRASIADRTE